MNSPRAIQATFCLATQEVTCEHSLRTQFLKCDRLLVRLQLRLVDLADGVQPPAD